MGQPAGGKGPSSTAEPTVSAVLLKPAHGDENRYRDYRDRYRAIATSLGFEGHMAWAEAMHNVFRHRVLALAQRSDCSISSSWRWRSANSIPVGTTYKPTAQRALFLP